MEQVSPVISLALLVLLTGCDSGISKDLFGKEDPEPTDSPTEEPVVPEIPETPKPPVLVERIPNSESLEFNDLDPLIVKAEFQGENLTYRWNIISPENGTVLRSGIENQVTLSGVHPEFDEGKVYTIEITASDANNQSAKTSWQAALVRKATYVSATGSDVAMGTPLTPIRTIARGIQIAKDFGRSHVLVAGGTYAHFTPSDGISVLGGFDPTNAWARDTVNHETVVNLSTLGLLILDFHQKTEFSGLNLIGSNATTSGQSVYGVRVIDSSHITLQNNTIRSGRAGTGASGASGVSGLSGLPGSPGRSGTNYSSFETRPGGAGGLAGTSPCQNGSLGSGGTGGQGGDVVAIPGIFGIPYDEASPGRNGLSAAYVIGSYGQGGYGGYPETSGWGGSNGKAGIDGSSGTPASSSSYFEGDQIEPTVGSSGGIGANGTGGGGGGGGGSSIDGVGYSGGGGGGGGSGGCGGKPGLGGQSGGASIGVFVISSSYLVITNNRIQSGSAGHGGAGGSGGSGGYGGIGGSGGIGFDHAGSGGYGGTGGSGGQGGHGGPGAGGDSIGVFLVDSVLNIATLKNQNTIQMEAAGTGGSNPGGVRGPNGVRTEVKSAL